MQSLDTGRRPRGALLLLVLGILTLFMLIGTVTLSLATRARTTSRAFAAATTGATVAPLRARTHLEEALLQLIRGSAVSRSAGLSESLLEDMYGSSPAVEGSVVAVRPEGSLVAATITLNSGSMQAADLCGRVVTIIPQPDSCDPISTHRILRASGTGTLTCLISRLQSDPDAALPTPPCRIVVNPPAFRDEAYDAYDAANPWLTKLSLQDGHVASVPRPAFAAQGTTPTVDNDNDGVKDGVWLTNVLGSRPAAGGGRLEFDASYLVLDLDGRINVNAHGSRTSIDFAAATGVWDFAPPAPTGSGYGPADVDASLLFVDPLRTNEVQADPPLASDIWRRLVGATAVGNLTAVVSSTSQRRPVPLVGPVDGRYGTIASPGISGTNDRVSERADRLFATGTARLPVANSTIDLKSMVKATLQLPAGAQSSSAPVPEVSFYCPDWSQSNYVDDPYEMRLDANAPRPSSLRSGTAAGPADNPFTLAELETVLRQFDIDAPTSPPRLVAALDATSQRSRMLITTDSWDTPGLTGTVAAEIANYAAPVASGTHGDVKLEAEKGNPYEVVRGSDSACSGGEYVTFDQASDRVSWPSSNDPFNATPGTYDMEVRYRKRSDSSGTVFSGTLNGVPVQVDLERSETTFSSAFPASFTLKASNTLTVGGSGAFDIDFVKFTPKTTRDSVNADPATLLSPDVLAGLRFDINRPFPADNAATPEDEEKVAKAEFCKHLYMLLVALGQPPSEATAQWAANVVDYRDTDSSFTRFKFDTVPEDGWGEGTSGWAAENTVWGLERPELVIAQTISYYTVDNSGTAPVGDGLAVSLYRPAFMEKLTTSGTLNGNKRGLVVTQTNTAPPLDLAEKSSQSSQPVWRLRIEPGTFVRFDKPGSSDKEVPGVFRMTGGTKDSAVVAPDSYLVVVPQPSRTTGNSGTSAISIPVDPAFKRFEINSGGVFKSTHWPGAASYQSGSDTIVFLERLEDPTKPWNEDRTSGGYNPYVPLDRMGVKRVNRTGENANNWKTFIRQHAVWNNGPFETTGNSAGIVKLDPEVKSWLPWPNRPFISQAELAVVSPGNGTSRFWDYKIPRLKKDTSPYYYLPTPKLLDATIVPSRFVGSQVSVDPAELEPVGLNRVPFNQLSRWRDPGRVNLNTIVSNTGCADPQRDNAVWWATLGRDAAVSLDEFQAAGPATSIDAMLTLMQSPAIYVDSAADAGVKGNSWKKNRQYDLDPLAAYATAIRLANVATIRSHVFAVWITLRIRDTSPGGIDTFHRLFAIVDRSRPVGYTNGQDLNVRDTIRVIRFLQ
jgi:hypothetical protein